MKDRIKIQKDLARKKNNLKYINMLKMSADFFASE